MSARPEMIGDGNRKLVEWLEALAYDQAAEITRLTSERDEFKVYRDSFAAARNELTVAVVERDALRAEVARLTEALRQEQRSHEHTVDQRDQAEEWADRLAAVLASEDEIGEHSSANNPWANAVEIGNAPLARLTEANTALRDERGREAAVRLLWQAMQPHTFDEYEQWTLRVRGLFIKLGIDPSEPLPENGADPMEVLRGDKDRLIEALRDVFNAMHGTSGDFAARRAAEALLAECPVPTIRPNFDPDCSVCDHGGHTCPGCGGDMPHPGGACTECLGRVEAEDAAALLTGAASPVPESPK